MLQSLKLWQLYRYDFVYEVLQRWCLPLFFLWYLGFSVDLRPCIDPLFSFMLYNIRTPQHPLNLHFQPLPFTFFTHTHTQTVHISKQGQKLMPFPHHLIQLHSHRSDCSLHEFMSIPLLFPTPSPSLPTPRLSQIVMGIQSILPTLIIQNINSDFLINKPTHLLDFSRDTDLFGLIIFYFVFLKKHQRQENL